MLDSLAKKLRGKRTVVLGVGNLLGGDDAVGPNLVDSLHGRVDATLINGEEVPENYLSAIKTAQPEVVLIVAALDLRAEPGCMAILDADRLRAIENFTRNPGLALLTVLIQDATNAEVMLVGIQPGETTFAAALTSPVHETMNSLEAMLVDVL